MTIEQYKNTDGFGQLWHLQELFYADRDLMWKSNQDIPRLLGRIEEEAQECREELEKCMKFSSVDGCVNLLDEQIRQEVSDLFLFIMALARCLGMSDQMMVSDAKEKVARNMARYPSANFKDTTDDFSDKVSESRSWDKRRGFTNAFYQIPT